ncbi:isochorismate synthase [Salinilacihabitans rarus]|uniref:isochorismate synthase n=1 Tax=Salinilacihabitans rarus TaxID=2961596 RepID=UPI0020C8C345|nr:isochorismate synthase [Salinilacihabitans rarus]
MDRASGDRGLTGVAEGADAALHSRSSELEDVSFGAVLDADGDSLVAWATPDGLEVVGCGVAARLSATGPERFERIRADARRLFDDLDHDGPAVARPRAFGGFAFHDGHEATPPWRGFDAATFVVPEVLVVRSEAGTWLTGVARSEAAASETLDAWRERLAGLPAMRPSGDPPGVVETRRTTTREEWTEGVETALDRIDAGDLEKVVLAQALSVSLAEPIDVPATLERLRRRYPNCYRFLVGYGAGTFFGAPPERLVAKRGDRVETEALAGSVPRGESPEGDEELAARLLDSEKFRREHGLVVEAIREQLAPLARAVTVDDRTVRRLATIQHLRTPIEATLADGAHVLDIVEALHPTPAVGGVPPDAAWETIRSVETFDRGWYASPVGWFDAAGDGEFAVGIRSGVATDESVTLFAGNGIVADSDPDEEWEEVLLKYRPILDELRR